MQKRQADVGTGWTGQVSGRWRKECREI